MSDTPYLGETTDLILGQEFLTWLWFKSDTAPGSFTLKDGSPFSASMEQRIVVQGGEGDSRETTSVSGNLSPLREARYGIAAGKKVTRALLLLEKEDMSWQVSLKAEDFALGSLKTPKIDTQDADDEPDALLLEKFYLIETALAMLDALYARFLGLRLSPQWAGEVRDLQHWLDRTE